MTVRQLLAAIRAEWKHVVAATALGAIAAFVITLFLPREYESSSTLYVSADALLNNPATAYQGGLLSEQRVKSYSELALSQRIGQEVVARLQLPEAPQDLLKSLSVSSQPDSVVLTITARATSPQNSLAIANASAESLVRLVGELEAPANGSGPASVTARVVNPAVLAIDSPLTRPIVNVLSGTIAGFLLGCSVVLLRRSLDQTVKIPADLTPITDAPVLGIVPLEDRIGHQPLITMDDSGSVVAESFKQIRTALQFVAVDRAQKVVAVTSPLPNEGKTTCVCNLAAVLAQAGFRVVVVEADLRKPRAAAYLGLDGAVGVTTVLTGRATVQQVTQHVRHGGFDVVAAGPLPPNPSELLGSARMAEFLKDLEKVYDYVLIDVPPTLPVTDAAVLAHKTDGVLVVVKHGTTTRNDVTRTTATLGGASAQVIGIVINMSPREKDSRYYQYYSERVDGSDGRHSSSRPSPVPRIPRPQVPHTGDGRDAGLVI